MSEKQKATPSVTITHVNEVAPTSAPVPPATTSPVTVRGTYDLTFVDHGAYVECTLGSYRERDNDLVDNKWDVEFNADPGTYELNAVLYNSQGEELAADGPYNVRVTATSAQRQD